MGKKITVEFRYFDRNTCSRCKTTDKNVEKTVQGLREALRESGIGVELKATKLPASKLAQSNSVLINGKDVEELVKGKGKKHTSACFGCGELLESSCNCRAYTYMGKKYRYIPKAMILEAIRKVSGLTRTPVRL